MAVGLMLLIYIERVIKRVHCFDSKNWLKKVVLRLWLKSVIFMSEAVVV